ncbi:MULTISPECIES: hypothetical protein [unclassified Streptomyces]
MRPRTQQVTYVIAVLVLVVVLLISILSGPEEDAPVDPVGTSGLSKGSRS